MIILDPLTHKDIGRVVVTGRSPYHSSGLPTTVVVRLAPHEYQPVPDGPVTYRDDYSIHTMEREAFLEFAIAEYFEALAGLLRLTK